MSKAKPIEKRNIEKVKCYIVTVPALALGTVEDYLRRIDTKQFKKVEEESKKHNSIGIWVKKNQLKFAFLLNSDKNMFYNSIKDTVKCRSLKKPEVVKRAVPNQNPSAKA